MSGQPLLTDDPRSQEIEDKLIDTFRSLRESQYQKGTYTYGTTLKTFNGRSAYQDAMEEWTDLGRYITQLELERDWFENRVSRLTEGLVRIQERAVERFSQLKHSYDRELAQYITEILADGN